MKQKELDTFLKKNLHTGQIWPSKFFMVTLVFFIKKKDSLLCSVQDYFSLNTMTIKNKYFLLLISKLVLQLYRAKYFTKLDVCWGFNNVCIKPGDEWKAMFYTICGLFEPLVMFFSMTNSSAMF